MSISKYLSVNSDLSLTLFDTFGHSRPNIAFVLAQSLFGLGLGQGADGIFLGLVANIGGQCNNSLHHVVPVLLQPVDGVGISAMIQCDLNVLGSKATLFGLLQNISIILFLSMTVAAKTLLI